MHADLGDIRVPTLLMRGETGRMLSAEAARDATALVEECELAVIPRAGRSVQGDNPQDFARVLDDFLTRRLSRTQEGQVRTTPRDSYRRVQPTAKR